MGWAWKLWDALNNEVASEVDKDVIKLLNNAEKALLRIEKKEQDDNAKPMHLSRQEIEYIIKTSSSSKGGPTI